MEDVAGCFTLIVLLLSFWILCAGCLSRGAVGLSVVCDCGISWLYSLAFFALNFNSHEQTQLIPFLCFIIVY